MPQGAEDPQRPWLGVGLVVGRGERAPALRAEQLRWCREGVAPTVLRSRSPPRPPGTSLETGCGWNLLSAPGLGERDHVWPVGVGGVCHIRAGH